MGALLTGFGLAVFARLSDLLPAIVVLGVLGVPLAALNTVFVPLLLRAAPRD
jgi:hypothetical protein